MQPDQRSAMAHLMSNKYTTFAVQIKYLEFYYCLNPALLSWISNYGYVGPLWLEEVFH